MLQIRCTKKVLDQFGLGKTPSELKPPDSMLGNWYANLIKIDRRKTLLFMSERSYLSFIIFGVRKDNAKDLAQVFLRGLAQLLTLEGFDESDVNRVLKDYDRVEYTKTGNRKALGNLNDLARQYEHCIYYDGGLKTADIWDIIQSTNRMPQRNLNWAFSIDIATEIIHGKTLHET